MHGANPHAKANPCFHTSAEKNCLNAFRNVPIPHQAKMNSNSTIVSTTPKTRMNATNKATSQQTLLQQQLPQYKHKIQSTSEPVKSSV